MGWNIPEWPLDTQTNNTLADKLTARAGLVPLKAR